jgi:nitronate monooxygenase
VTRLHDTAIAVPVPLAQPFGNDEVQRLAQGLIAGIAKHALRARIPEAEDAVTIGGDDRVRVRRKNRFGEHGGKVHDVPTNQNRAEIMILVQGDMLYFVTLDLALTMAANCQADEENSDVTLRTRLTDKLGIRHPVLLAPMGSIAGGRLAGAVSEAGGLGLIGGGYGEKAWLDREFAAAGNRRVGCGFITWALAEQPKLLDHVLARRPAALMLSFGDPRPLATRIREAGVPFICQAQSSDHVLQALDAGAEIIVAQGTEAGGHGGQRATLPLVPAVADLVARRAPQAIVVAAGGIADGRGMAAALALGAEGVLVGTRFYATVEALGHDKAKARIVAAAGEDTVRTSVFDSVRGYSWPRGITGRALRNDFTERWHGREGELAIVLDGEKERYQAAATRGDPDTAVVFAGEGADQIDDLPHAGEMVTRLVVEAERALVGAARLVI